MTPWHEGMVAKIGFRILGAVLLLSAWAEARLLRGSMALHPGSGPSPALMMLAGLLFVSASAGSALLVMGAALWEPVALSDRWVARDQAAL